MAHKSLYDRVTRCLFSTTDKFTPTAGGRSSKGGPVSQALHDCVVCAVEVDGTTVYIGTATVITSLRSAQQQAEDAAMAKFAAEEESLVAQPTANFTHVCNLQPSLLHGDPIIGPTHSRGFSAQPQVSVSDWRITLASEKGTVVIGEDMAVRRSVDLAEFLSDLERRINAVLAIAGK